MSRKQISSAPWASYAVACSTGSPASRSCTKFVPLTTRPFATSRHGMILRASMRDLRRLLDRELAIVERTSDDDRGDAGVAQPREILERADSARRDHFAVDRALQLRG